MEITFESCEDLIAKMSPQDQTQVLALFGQELTIISRCVYEVHGPGVTNPILLREINEIQHRVFNQIVSHTHNLKPTYSPNVLEAMLLGKASPKLQVTLARAFQEALTRHNKLLDRKFD